MLPGCAFAQFKSKEAADRCIAATQDESEVICLTHAINKLEIFPVSTFFYAELSRLSCFVKWIDVAAML